MNVTTIVSRPTAAPKPPSRMVYANVTKGVLERPMKILIYGEAGFAKSSFAAHAPRPIWLGGENGSDHLPVARYPDPQSYEEVVEAIRDARQHRDKHDTFVFDPLGFFEPFVEEKVRRDNGWATLEEPGYGRGPQAVFDQWRVLLHEIEQLYYAGMHIVIIAHADKKTETSPDVETFDKYVIALKNQKAAHLLDRWCDYVLFVQQRIWTTKGKDKRFRGTTDGSLVMHATAMPYFRAKSRPALPGTLPVSWRAFMEARAAVSTRKKDLRSRVDELLLELNDESAAQQALDYIAEAPDDDTSRLEEVVNVLANEIAKKDTQT
ncbi:AAA family ATPase [Pendulispora brunnea]|uniref:AAA family ATPase n=1 Tax=Pendulispora brunnea TaxID=2905690 RepID=A0ABZ2KDU9_9BACT